MSEALPNPPHKFTVRPIRQSLKAGVTLWRIYFRGGPHPGSWKQFRHFGPTASRFDHHKKPSRIQKRGIIYASDGPKSIETVLAEVFQDTRLIDRFHNSPWLVGFELVNVLWLLNTGSNWPVRAGGNMAINSGSRVQSRKWSRKIYKQYASVQGIRYPSSITGQPCSAMYEKSAFALPSNPVVHKALDDPSLLPGLSRIAARLNYALK